MRPTGQYLLEDDAGSRSGACLPGLAEPVHETPEKGEGGSPGDYVEQATIDEEADLSERRRVPANKSDVVVGHKQPAGEDRKERGK